jgi:DNA-binding GntR family transcriptional regulator
MKKTRAKNPVAMPPSTATGTGSTAEADSRLRYQVIHDHLKSAIALGRIAPGLVLLEGPVARIFGTSRVPVRKAFEMLYEGGLLHTFEGRGYLVADPAGEVPEPVRAPLSEATLGFDQQPAPLDIRSTSQRIYHALEGAVSIGIAFGHFRIDESVAAETFGVSRGTVREALNRLRDLGLVEKSAYSHWLARPLTARAVKQDYEMRVLLEPAALLASAASLDRHELEQAYADIERALADPGEVNADRLQELEDTLHVRCLRHAGNRKMLQTIAHCHLPLTVDLAFHNAFNLPPQTPTLEEHRVVLDHLLAGNAIAASEALADHLRATQKRTLQHLKVLAVLPEPELPAYMQRII